MSRVFVRGNVCHGSWLAAELICLPRNAGESNRRDKYISSDCMIGEESEWMEVALESANR